MATIKTALESVGHKTADDRLSAAIGCAWKFHPSDESAALERLISEVYNDAGILWSLVPDDIRRALAFRLHVARPQTKSESGKANKKLSPNGAVPSFSPTPSKDGGHSHLDTQNGHAAVLSTLSAGGGQIQRDTHGRAAATAPKPLPPSRPARAPLGGIVVLTQLQRETISLPDGRMKRLADATAAEVRAFAKRLGFRAEWMERLAANLPDGWIIGEHCTDEDMQRVQRETREGVAI